MMENILHLFFIKVSVSRNETNERTNFGKRLNFVVYTFYHVCPLPAVFTTETTSPNFLIFNKGKGTSTSAVYQRSSTEKTKIVNHFNRHIRLKSHVT